MEVFDELRKINVNDKTETKEASGVKLTYLSWTFAWEEVKKRFPTASYEIVMHDGLPYVYDENTGYMVFTSVTIEGVTHMMWLPVMDANNRAMKSKPYSITFKSGKSIEVAAATMFDVNKTIMRCLVKNLAMFGLGLYIYAGEDIPQAEKEEAKAQEEAKKRAESLAVINKALEYLNKENIPQSYVCELYKLDDIKSMTQRHADNIIKHIEEIKNKYEESK